MDDPVVLVYVGDRDGHNYFLLNFPKSDIRQSQLVQMARVRGEDIDTTRDFLLAYTRVWELPPLEPEPEPEIIPEPEAPVEEPFRAKPVQAPGEAAFDKRRRRET